MDMYEERAKTYAGSKPRLAVDNTTEDDNGPPPFALQPLVVPDQRSIPHRKWLYGTQLIRGYVSILVAPGGTGKSTMILAMALAMATNRKLLRTHIHQQCRVALLNLEDPQDEIDRRLAALCVHYNIRNDDLDGRLFASPPERIIRIAANGPDGFSIVHPDEEAIIKEVKDNKIDALAVDPFAESHTLEENSNPAMIQAAAAWRRVARAGGCSVLLAHHVRKGPMDSIESARGAKALTDSARIGLLLSTMSKDDAKELGIAEEDRFQYVRLDDAKANLARRAGKATWFQLRQVTLDNAEAPYKEGDEVGVIEHWEQPSVWDNMSVDEANQILDLIAKGPTPGVLYTDSRRHPGTRWAGNAVMQVNGHNPDQAAKIINTWVSNGVLMRTTYEDSHRNERGGVIVVDAKRPGPRP